MRDTISAKDYEPLCEKLIAQFRTLWETLRDTVRLQRFSEQFSHEPSWCCTQPGAASVEAHS